MRHHFGLTEKELLDGMTFWQSEEFMAAVPEFFGEKTESATEASDIDDFTRAGIPLSR